MNEVKNEPEKITIKKRAVTNAEIAEALKASHGIQTVACKWLAQNKGVKIDRSTLSRRIAKDEELRQIAQTETEIVLDVAENKLFSLINKGDKTAIIFFLKCKGKARGYVERHEVEADVRAETKNVNPFDGMTTEEIKALAHGKAD